MSEAAAAELAGARDGLAAVRAQMQRVIVGQDDVIDQLLVALLAGGHVLLEGAPGLGKTLLVRSLAGALDLRFRRLQCTPDLMPSDVTGNVIVESRADGPSFAFQEGPVFTQVLLCDEINRATPKTQSALLEAMEERQVTAGGETRALPDPFVLLATQNPVEMEGTYPLPEAQLDRFLLKVLVRRPDVDELEEIMHRTTGTQTSTVESVLVPEALAQARTLTRGIALAPAVRRAIAELIGATHPDSAAATDDVRRLVRFGASPRAAQALALTAKARALLAGRAHVSLGDLRHLAPAVLRHRLILGFEAEAEGIDADQILATLLPRLDTA